MFHRQTKTHLLSIDSIYNNIIRILALSACSHKPLDPPAPEIEVDETAPISFTTGVVGTKGLIENQTALDNANTVIKVYDFMTVGTGTSAQTVKYIDDHIIGKNIATDGSWSYFDPANPTSTTNSVYYWTKTGTHSFFGWLTQDPKGTAFSGSATLDTDRKLTVSASLLPNNESQFDFLYSDIKSYTMPERPNTTNKAVDLQMSHLFTALSVEVSNQTGKRISNLVITFKGMMDQRTAEIDFDGTAEPGYDDGSAVDMSFGNVTELESPTTATFVPLYSTDPYRLLWPQDDLSEVTITITCKVDGKDSAYSPAPFPTAITEMVAGKKYLLKITINPVEVMFDITVHELDNINDKKDSDGNPVEEFNIVS